MKTIKIIDLLNKIANDIDVTPKNIKYNDKYFEYKLWLEPNKYAYVEKGTNNTLEEYCCFYDLNDKLEILEDEKKIPEKLNIRYKNDDIIINEKILQEDLNTELADKINEILDYLESKEDE